MAAFLSGPGWDSTRRKQSGRGNGERETRRNAAAAAAETRCDESLKTSAGVGKILATGVSVQLKGSGSLCSQDILFGFFCTGESSFCVCEDLKYEFFSKAMIITELP